MVVEVGQGSLPNDQQPDYPMYVLPLEQCHPQIALEWGTLGSLSWVGRG